MAGDALAATVAGCRAAHRRLEATLDALDDATARRDSLLPGWTVGHVLTHLARNADSHTRILQAAAAGDSVEQYPGGPGQRSRDIDAGAGRTAGELRADVRASTAALEAAWDRLPAEAWRGHGLSGGVEWPCWMLPLHRWREVEVHHVDLGVGYTPDDWPDDYVGRELPLALATLPDRLDGGDRRRLLAWLVGRTGAPADLAPAPWQAKREYYHLPASDLGEVDRRLLTVFRSRLRADGVQGYQPVAERMRELAETMPGYLEVKTFTAEDGERVSLVTFASPEQQAAWRAHPEHRAAQRRGREEFYDDYLLQVCTVRSERSFRRERP